MKTTAIVVVGVVVLLAILCYAYFKCKLNIFLAGVKEDMMNVYMPELLKPRPIKQAEALETAEGTDDETTEGAEQA